MGFQRGLSSWSTWSPHKGSPHPTRAQQQCPCVTFISTGNWWTYISTDLWPLSSEIPFCVAAHYAQSEEFLLEMCVLRECGLYGILYSVGLTFTQSVCWGGEFKWCAGKCPLKILIFFPSFLFHFKPSSGNGSWFKNEISDLPANISHRGLNLHFTQKNHFSQLRCLSKHQCLNQGKEEMQRMKKHAPGATAEERACLRDSAGALKAGIQH